MVEMQNPPARWSGYQPMENAVQLGASTVKSHSPTWLLAWLVILFLCRCVPAEAAEVDAPKWMKVCVSNPDPACTTLAQIEPTMAVQVFEPGQTPSIKKLRVIVNVANGSPSLQDTVKISVDAKGFAQAPFVFCNAYLCAAEKDLSDDDMAALAGAGSLEIEAPGKSVKAPIGNFAAVHAGRGMTEAEFQAEMERATAALQQKFRDRADEINKRLRDGEAELKEKNDRERLLREQREQRRRQRD